VFQKQVRVLKVRTTVNSLRTDTQITFSLHFTPLSTEVFQKQVRVLKVRTTLSTVFNRVDKFTVTLTKVIIKIIFTNIGSFPVQKVAHKFYGFCNSDFLYCASFIRSVWTHYPYIKNYHIYMDFSAHCFKINKIFYCFISCV